jgi:hypothetical protein
MDAPQKEKFVPQAVGQIPAFAQRLKNRNLQMQDKSNQDSW